MDILKLLSKDAWRIDADRMISILPDFVESVTSAEICGVAKDTTTLRRTFTLKSKGSNRQSLS